MDGPVALNVKVRWFHIGESAPEPVLLELPPTCSYLKAKHTIDALIAKSSFVTPEYTTTLPVGSCIFGKWVMKTLSPSRKTVREVSAHLLYDFNRLTSIGVKEKSSILLRPTKDGKIRIEWYVNSSDTPAFRPLPTPEELAAIATASKVSPFHELFRKKVVCSVRVGASVSVALGVSRSNHVRKMQKKKWKPVNLAAFNLALTTGHFVCRSYF